MSPTMTMAMHSAMYTPTNDVMERHEYGITKHHRKNSSTGGGRAWSEDEVCEIFNILPGWGEGCGVEGGGC